VARKFILAIDQGTTNTKVLLMAHSGEVAASASRPLAIAFPQPGWVEQDANALWTSVVEAADDCLGQVPEGEIVAIGISNQRESVVAWDRATGKPLGACIVWQCRRTAAKCAELNERGHNSFIQERSGLAIDPLFSSSKIDWLLGHIEDGHSRAGRGELCAGTVDSWLLWNLTGGTVHGTDATNASRMQLLNLRRVEWDADLLKLFGVPEACLPRVLPSSGFAGCTVKCGAIPAGVPVASLIGDSHAALFGHAAFFGGVVKATYGTGSSLMMLTDEPVLSRHGLSSTIAWSEGGKVHYALEGNITSTGATMQWLGEILGLSDPAQDAAALAATVADTKGVYLAPAFAGLGAPYWDPGARGLICGLTRGCTAAHIARAAMDSIAYQVRDVFGAMCKDSGVELPLLLADGGASRNDLLMQFQADILGCPVVRSRDANLSARGAAWLAGLAAGFWRSPAELAELCEEGRRFEPAIPESLRQVLLSGWCDAVSRARSRGIEAPALPAQSGG
jgi:glycerol kinase